MIHWDKRLGHVKIPRSSNSVQRKFPGVSQKSRRALKFSGGKHAENRSLKVSRWLQLTYEVIGGHDDATGEENRGGDSVMSPEDHVIDYRLVHEVSHLDEPGYSRHQAEHRHLVPRSRCCPPESKPRETITISLDLIVHFFGTVSNNRIHDNFVTTIFTNS